MATYRAESSSQMLLWIAQHTALVDAGFDVYKIRKIKPRTLSTHASNAQGEIPLSDLPQHILDKMRINLGLVLRILDSLLHQVKSLMPGASSSDLQGTSELPAVSCIMWLESKPFAIMEHPFVTSAAQVVQIVSWLLVRIFLGKHVANQTRSTQDLERLAVHALSTRSLVTSTHNRILELLANPDLLPSCTPISCTPISLSQALGTIGRLVVGILSRILGQPSAENSLTESFVAATVRIVSQAACIRVVEPRIDDEQLVTLVLTLNQPDLRSLHLDVMTLPKTSTVDFRGMGAALLHAVRMFQEFEDSAGTDPVAFFRRCFIERKTSV
jgi:hypothetical protein